MAYQPWKPKTVAEIMQMMTQGAQQPGLNTQTPGYFGQINMPVERGPGSGYDPRKIRPNQPPTNVTPKNQKAAIIMGALSDIFRGQDTTQNTIARQQQMVAMDAQRKAQERYNQIYSQATPDMQKIMGRYPADQWEKIQAQLDLAALQPPDYKIQQLQDGNYYYVDPTGNRPPMPVSNIEAKVDPKPKSDLENQLRDEHTNGSGEYIKVKDAYARVDAAGRDPSAAGDLALIFNFMKMLDPGSTVREGEFANAQNSAGVGPRVQAMYNSVISGQRLADTQRNDFMDRADSLYQAALRGQKQLDKAYKGIAERNKVNVDNVVIDYASSVKDIVFSNKLRQLELIELENYDRSNLSEEQINMLDQMITIKKVPNTTPNLVPTTEVDALVEKYQTK